MISAKEAKEQTEQHHAMLHLEKQQQVLIRQLEFKKLIPELLEKIDRNIQKATSKGRNYSITSFNCAKYIGLRENSDLLKQAIQYLGYEVEVTDHYDFCDDKRLFTIRW